MDIGGMQKRTDRLGEKRKAADSHFCQCVCINGCTWAGTQVKGDALPDEGRAAVTVFFCPGRSVNGLKASKTCTVMALYNAKSIQSYFFVKGQRVKSAGL